MEIELKLGQLLASWGILSQNDVDEASEMARDLDSPVGKILVRCNFLQERDLKTALELQSLLRDELISDEAAAKAMKYALKNECEAEDALIGTGWTNEHHVRELNRLGQILVNANILTKMQLEQTLSVARVTTLPLGRVLQSQGLINPQLLQAVLDVQQMLRQGHIMREHAVLLLMVCQRSNCTLRQAFDQMNLPWPFTGGEAVEATS